MLWGFPHIWVVREAFGDIAALVDVPDGGSMVLAGKFGLHMCLTGPFLKIWVPFLSPVSSTSATLMDYSLQTLG